MYCAHCGSEIAASAKFCSGCGQAVDTPGAAAVDANEPPVSNTSHPHTRASDPASAGATSTRRYAGFWVRGAAALVDVFILFGLLIVVQMGLGAVFPRVMAGPTHPGVVLTLHLFMLAYLIGFEASAYQATPGKKMFRLQVIDPLGARLSLGRAIARSLSKYLSGFTLLIGYLMAAFTKNKRALHDMIATTYVIHDPAPVKMR